MTALCGGGTSGPKPGVTGILTFSAFGIEAFISSVLLLPELAPLLAPIIASLVDIEATAYCSTDPPPDPGLTATDLENAIKIPPGPATFIAQSRILQWFENQYWWSICQCSGTTPARPTPSNPGAVTSNGGLPQGNSVCWNVTIPYSIPAAPTGVFFFIQIQDQTATLVPAGGSLPVAISAGNPSPTNLQAMAVPPGITQVKLTHTLNEAVQAGSNYLELHLDTWNSSGAIETTDPLHAYYFGSSPNVIVDFQPNMPVAAYWLAYILNTDSIPHTGTFGLSFICPPGVAVGQPCCPPDPLIEGELQQILQYVQAIYAGLAVPPNSFAEGAVHAGLTSNGSVTFSGVPIALKVTLTTVPNWVGVAVGSPDFYFDAGYLSFGTSEGNYAQSRIELQQQVLSVPLLAGSVGYTIRDGIVASITELVAGP